VTTNLIGGKDNLARPGSNAEGAGSPARDADRRTSRLERVPVLTTAPCPQRVEALPRLGGRAAALSSLQYHPRDHDEFADSGQHGVTRPLQQVVPVHDGGTVGYELTPVS
jgi:hypothetical protein